MARGRAGFRALCCRGQGCEHVSRYVTGLILRANKTLHGIDELQVWDHDQPSRRARHEAVFEAGWDSHALIQRHRLDWTLAPHERGPHIVGGDQADDDVQRRMTRVQTVVTAVIAHRRVLDGLAVVVQEPKSRKEEMA